ncbi:autotransporter domain-containing protein [Methylovirgula sp. HY1]|uniref:autotransporter domain-containing protein n=1 Tax=Methylovirgula sp. HY1 TaxID=2822761 RepID=UPI001C793C3C|nr:autotransporter domain-containing protein [Methylovirgula sp. HY1]QXX75159.1 hypothetical protein MHY1_01978 [Methylovirgula sp. HY1]
MRRSVCVAAVKSGRMVMGGVSACNIGKTGFAGVLAAALALFAATGARAQCTSSVPGGALPAANLAPFAMGAPVNTLLSAINAENTIFLTQSTAFIASPSNPQPNEVGGSVWARSIGGEQTTKGTATSNYSYLGAPVSGGVSCRTSTDLTFGGAQVGTDVTNLNLNGWNLHAGSTLGYLGAAGQDTTRPGAANAAGGSFNDVLQIPFVGAYGAATKGNLFLDGQIRWLYFQNGASDPQNGLFNQHFDARGTAINGDVGYNFGFQNNWFVTPSAGFIWSKTTVAPFNTAGTSVLGTGTALPGQVSINNIYNAIGRLSLRVGTTVDAGYMILQPFGTASFFREFEGEGNVTFGNTPVTLNGTFLPANAVRGSLTTTGIGNYGEFGVGITGQIKNTGWLSFVSADYRTGDYIQGWNLNAGIRYLFEPETQRLVTKGPAEPVSPYNWTGLRIGATLGADWGYSNWNFVGTGAGTNPRFAGILPGGLIGYDYQIGKWVVGAGADMGWTNANGTAGCPASAYLSCENQADWLATATGRVGYTFWGDRVLTYGKAGLALADFTTKLSCNTDAQATPNLIGGVAGCPGTSASKLGAGWTIGAGTEFGLTPNWSVRAETSYFNLGKELYQPVLGGVSTPINVTHEGFTATIGLAYRFDVGMLLPVVAKY